jgi:hypothetical protein
MVGKGSHGRPEILDEVAAGRRAAMLGFAINQQENGHHAEAQDIYRQLIREYPGTDEEAEARERMLDMAQLFASEKQPYRMLSLYGTLENLYAREGAPNVEEARRARVREIVNDIHKSDKLEEEAEVAPPATPQNEDLPWEETVVPSQQIAARRRRR